MLGGRWHILPWWVGHGRREEGKLSKRQLSTKTYHMARGTVGLAWLEKHLKDAPADGKYSKGAWDLGGKVVLLLLETFSPRIGTSSRTWGKS